MHGITDIDGNPFGRDFTYFWTAAQFLKEGKADDIYTAATYLGALKNLFNFSTQLYWGYPPYFLFWLWPLTYVSDYSHGYCLWLAMNMVVFIFALFWRNSLDGAWRWIVFSIPALLLCLFVGQNGILSAALLVGGFRLLKSSPWGAGAVFGLLWFKPQLAICIPFILLALGHYRALITLVLTVAALALSSTLAFGVQIWRAYLNIGTELQAQMLHHPFGKMYSVYGNAVMFMPLSYAMGLQLCVAAAVVVVLCIRFRRLKEAHWTEWLKLAAPAMYLVTPYGFVYDLCALNVAWVCWLACRQERGLNPYDIAIWLLLWYIPLYNSYLYSAHLPLIPLLMAAAFISTAVTTRFRPQ